MEAHNNCKFDLTVDLPEDQKYPNVLLMEQSSPNDIKGHQDGSTGMKALAKDVQSDFFAGRKANERKQPNRLTIAQGVANMEIFGSAGHQDHIVTNAHEHDQNLINLADNQKKVQLSLHSEIRAAYASQIDRPSDFDRASIAGSQVQEQNRIVPQDNQKVYFTNAIVQDSKILTKSTLRNEEMIHKIAVLNSGQNQNNGYISDFYRKKQLKNDNQYAQSEKSKGSNPAEKSNSKNVAYGPYFNQIEFSNENVATNGNPASKLNKISSKKFFKSKIDFAAPIKILQNRGGALEANLSDDSYNEIAQNQYMQNNNYYEVSKEEQPQLQQQPESIVYDSKSRHQRKNQSHQDPLQSNQPSTIEGQTNLTLIKEEDFERNNSKQYLKRSYGQEDVRQETSNRDQTLRNPSKVRGRKASDATTIPLGSRDDKVYIRKQYQSLDRYETPLKLPNLTSNLSKKASYAGSQTIKTNHNNLQTVLENTYAKNHNANHKICKVCAARLKVGDIGGHHHHKGSGAQDYLNSTKGAPYFQQLVTKPPRQKANVSTRNTTVSVKKTNRIMKQQMLPKWKSKDYRPVFEVGETQANSALPVSQWQEEQRAKSISPNLITVNQMPRRDTLNLINASPRMQPETQRHLANQDLYNSRQKSNIESQTPLIERNLKYIQQHSLSKSIHNTSLRDNLHQQIHQNAAMNMTSSSIYSAKKQIAHDQLPLAYRSINKFNQTIRSNTSRIIEAASHPNDPELLCTEKILSENIEEEIKDGFFELKQKFKEVGHSSIYISHVVLHEKHPILKKIEVDTLKLLLLESSVIYLSIGQTLYRYGVQDSFVYIILFGKLLLQVPGSHRQNNNVRSFNNSNKGHDMFQGDDAQSQDTQHLIGRVNIGWTLGEEILFDRNLQIRQEMAVAETESCLIGINKAQLAIMQRGLLESGNEKDYFVIESILKGNFLIKDQWRREYQEETMHQQVDVQEINQHFRVQPPAFNLAMKKTQFM